MRSTYMRPSPQPHPPVRDKSVVAADVVAIAGPLLEIELGHVMIVVGDLSTTYFSSNFVTSAYGIISPPHSRICSITVKVTRSSHFRRGLASWEDPILNSTITCCLCYNSIGSKLPMLCAQAPSIELDRRRADFHFPPTACCGCWWEGPLRYAAAGLAATALRGMPRAPGRQALSAHLPRTKRNDDERTLRARIREAHARRESPGVGPRVTKRAYRLRARARAHPAAD